MYIFELAQQILREMRARKVRSILAIFGIAWGTFSVIMLLALGEGFYQASSNRMLSIADGSLVFFASNTSQSYHGMPKGAKVSIYADDVMRLSDAIPNMQYISPVVSGTKRLNLTYGSALAHTAVNGVNASYNDIISMQISKGGRFLNPLDVSQAAKVVFLGSKLKQRLFGDKPAVGQSILIQGIPFLVVGTMYDDEIHGRWEKRDAFIPYTTAHSLYGDIAVDNFFVVPKDIAGIDELQKDIQHYFARAKHYAPDDPSALRVFNTAEMKAYFLIFFRSIQFFLGFCGAMTLGVGAVGVANIMFLIVTERTREIGLRMALGARPSHIMFQIMLEAGLIVAVAGVMGIFSATVLTLILQAIGMPDWLGNPEISVVVIVVTLVILAIVALLAGFFPARRAAALDPVVALAS